jgi:hypothetical protein
MMFISLSYFSLSAFGAEFEFSLGAGFQYSWIIGIQLAIKHQNNKYFVSLGASGYSLSMQKIVSDNKYHSVGFSIGEIQGIFDGDSLYDFITYNYHLYSFENDGF